MQDSSELQAGRAQAPAERWMRTAIRQSLLECCMGAKALFSPNKAQLGREALLRAQEVQVNSSCEEASVAAGTRHKQQNCR